MKTCSNKNNWKTGNVFCVAFLNTHENNRQAHIVFTSKNIPNNLHLPQINTILTLIKITLSKM